MGDAPGTSIKDFLTIGCAVLGATLGIINTVTGLNQRRVKLRVIPKMYVRDLEGGVLSSSHVLLTHGAPAIEVINLSAFPVTIAEAGFTLKDEENRVISPIDYKPSPRRLESRASDTFYFPPGFQFPTNLHLAYATTDCEETRHGDSPALKKFRDQLGVQELRAQIQAGQK